MAPIHIYSQSPINAAKPDGVTPQTDGPTDEKASKAPPATTSAAAFAGAASGGPPARPGAVPSLPQPTGALRIHRYQPVQPTPTSNAADAGPPPPQPGAVPLPPSRGPPTDAQILQHHAQQTPVPSSAADASTSTAPPNQYPPQMSIPPLTSAAYPPLRGTSTSVQPQETTGAWPGIPQPTGFFAVPPPVDERDLGHPPGYVQNTHAGDMNSSERAAAQAEVYGSEDKDGVWDAAKKFAKAAGDRISAAETEVWRRINSESD